MIELKIRRLETAIIKKCVVRLELYWVRCHENVVTLRIEKKNSHSPELYKLCTYKYLFQWPVHVKKAVKDKSTVFTNVAFQPSKDDNFIEKDSNQSNQTENARVTSELHLYKTGSCRCKRNS